MRKSVSRLGWYSKIVLTVIAVSLVGLLVKELPREVMANIDDPGPLIPDAVEEGIKMLPEEEREAARNKYIEDLVKRELYEGVHPYFVGLRDEDIDEALMDLVVASDYFRLKGESRYERVNAILDSLYGGKMLRWKFRVKFVTDDFMILESEEVKWKEQ